MSGGNSKHTRSDTLHPKLYVETKSKQKHTVVTLWDDTATKAKKEKKLPVLMLAENGRPGFWIVVQSTDFPKLVEIYGEEQAKKLAVACKSLDKK